MTTKRRRITPEEERHIEHLYFKDGRSVNNIVKTQNLEWGIAVISRVVKDAKRRTAEKHISRRALAVLTDEEWTNMMTDHGNKYPNTLRVSRAKQAELKELRAIRKLLETLLESKEEIL